MKFGPVPITDASGSILAHAVHEPGLTLRKGETIGDATVRALAAAGVSTVVVARLETGDVGENEAAHRIADVVSGKHLVVDRPFTGRANLFARSAGVLRIDRAAVDALNGIDEAVTLATLEPYKSVQAGEMVGTVKIIPFAIPGSLLEQAVTSIKGALIDVAPFQPLRVCVVSTLLPGLKASVIAKTLAILAGRLAVAKAKIVGDLRVPHAYGPLAEALRAQADARAYDLIVVFGASAITDRRDVIPGAIEAAGGRVDHFGMPVDPGNLLLLGSLDGIPVIGAPGCARSPKENGFDWILHRILAGMAVTARDIQKLGAGGLLMEIVSRPQPRLAQAIGHAQRQGTGRDVSVKEEAAP